MLIIDDEPLITDILSRMLPPEHDAHLLTSGEEAQRRLNQDPGYDLVICDLIMPGFDGMDLYEWARGRGDGLHQRMLLMTGGAFTSRAERFLERHHPPLLEKPFDIERTQELIEARLRARDLVH